MTGQRAHRPNRDMWVLPVRQTHPDGTRLAMAAIQHAAGLITRVREEGPGGIAEITDPLTRDELVALAVVLAAMCDPDECLYDRLAWVDWAPEQAATA